MEWAIEHIIKRYANMRNIVVLGQGHNSLMWFSHISETATVSRRIETISPEINPEFDYLIIIEDKWQNHSEVLADLGFKETEDYYDWTKYARTNGHLPIDVEYNGAFIGCGSYFPYTKSNMKHIFRIGRFCSIANSVIIQGNHSMNRITTSSLYPMLTETAKQVVETAISDKDPHGTQRRIAIGNDVWIGANVFINSSTVSEIGDGAIIGANSLVLANVPPYAIVYGTPAKVQRYRFSPEQIETLLDVKWWEWNKEILSKNIKLLMNPEMFFKEFGDNSRG